MESLVVRLCLVGAGSLSELLTGTEPRLPWPLYLDSRARGLVKLSAGSFSKELRLALKEARVGEVGWNLFSLPPALTSRLPGQMPGSSLRFAGGILKVYKMTILTIFYSH